MSPQKCMSFSKCFNLEPENVVHFILDIEEINCRTKPPINKSRKQSFLDGFYAFENQN